MRIFIRKIDSTGGHGNPPLHPTVILNECEESFHPNRTSSVGGVAINAPRADVGISPCN